METENNSLEITPFWGRILIGRYPKRTLVRLTLLVFLTFFIFNWLLLPIRVSGMSMEPTYRDGGVNLVNQMAYRWKKPQRGDVVAIRMAGKKVMLLKRIIALPGERVSIVAGTVYINGEPLEESYVKLKGVPHLDEVHLPDEYYFVNGDNRSVSTFGRVHRYQIVGKVMF